MAKRRKSGTGSVHLRKDGRWEGRVVIGYDENGLPKTKNVLTNTKSSCVEKLKELQESLTPPAPVSWFNTGARKLILKLMKSREKISKLLSAIAFSHENIYVPVNGINQRYKGQIGEYNESCMVRKNLFLVFCTH